MWSTQPRVEREAINTCILGIMLPLMKLRAALTVVKQLATGMEMMVKA